MISPTKESVEEQLKQILLAVLKNEVDASRLQPDVALVDEGLSLDSVALLEFVVRIENEFGIIVDDGVLVREHFESLSSLAGVIQKEILRQTKT